MSEKTSQPTDQQKEKIDFETALAELETLVANMESGELSLDDSLKAFERGVKLARQCQTELKNAELKVQALTEDGEFSDLADFDTDQ